MTFLDSREANGDRVLKARRNFRNRSQHFLAHIRHPREGLYFLLGVFGLLSTAAAIVLLGRERNRAHLAHPLHSHLQPLRKAHLRNPLNDAFLANPLLNCIVGAGHVA